MSRHLESLEDRKLFAGYGVDGTASLRFRLAAPTESVNVEQLLTDSTGRAYVVASTKTTLQIQRLTAAGTPDTGWAKKGTMLFVRTDHAGGAFKARLDTADRLVVLVDDTIVRLADNGRSELNFARGGVLKVTGFDDINDFDVDANNKLYVTGSTDVAGRNVGTQTRVERFISRGRLDRTFASRGVYDMPFQTRPTGPRAGTSEGQFVRALSNGTVMVAALERQGATASPNVYVGAVARAVKFGPDGRIDASYGRNGIATFVAPSTTSAVEYQLEILGVRTTGQTIMLLQDTDRVVPSVRGVENYQMTVSGTGAIRHELVPGLTYTSAKFDQALNGRDLAVLDQRTVAVIETGGGIVGSFNGGHPVRVNYTTAFASAGSAAAAAPDGNILVAAVNRGNFRVTVGKISLTGTTVAA